MGCASSIAEDVSPGPISSVVDNVSSTQSVPMLDAETLSAVTPKSSGTRGGNTTIDFAMRTISPALPSAPNTSLHTNDSRGPAALHSSLERVIGPDGSNEFIVPSMSGTTIGGDLHYSSSSGQSYSYINNSQIRQLEASHEIQIHAQTTSLYPPPVFPCTNPLTEDSNIPAPTSGVGYLHQQTLSTAHHGEPSSTTTYIATGDANNIISGRSSASAQTPVWSEPRKISLASRVTSNVTSFSRGITSGGASGTEEEDPQWWKAHFPVYDEELRLREGGHQPNSDQDLQPQPVLCISPGAPQNIIPLIENRVEEELPSLYPGSHSSQRQDVGNTATTPDLITRADASLSHSKNGSVMEEPLPSEVDSPSILLVAPPPAAPLISQFETSNLDAGVYEERDCPIEIVSRVNFWLRDCVLVAAVDGCEVSP